MTKPNKQQKQEKVHNITDAVISDISKIQSDVSRLEEVVDLASSSLTINYENITKIIKEFNKRLNVAHDRVCLHEKEIIKLQDRNEKTEKTSSNLIISLENILKKINVDKEEFNKRLDINQKMIDGLATAQEKIIKVNNILLDQQRVIEERQAKLVRNVFIFLSSLSGLCICLCILNFFI